MPFLCDREGSEIYTVELYRKVRLACADGMSRRQAARHFNISRESVRKMLEFSVPPGYRRQKPVRRPKLEGFMEIIEGWFEDDKKVPLKQRHTAKRIFDRLRDEHGFTGGYTIVKEVRMLKMGRREYVQVLRLLETFGFEDLHAAVKHALRLGAVSFDAVKHLLLCQIEKRPPKLDLDISPYLPRANVATTSPASYMSLMTEAQS